MRAYFLCFFVFLLCTCVRALNKGVRGEGRKGRNKAWLLLPLLLLAFSPLLPAQSTPELIEALDDADTDAERYGILYDLTGQLLESGRKEDKVLAVTFSKQLYTTAKRLSDKKLSGPAAYTLALAYRNQRDDRNTDKFMAEAVELGMKAGQADLIMLAVAERNRLATKARNYRC